MRKRSISYTITTISMCLLNRTFFLNTFLYNGDFFQVTFSNFKVVYRWGSYILSPTYPVQAVQRKDAMIGQDKSFSESMTYDGTLGYKKTHTDSEARAETGPLAKVFFGFFLRTCDLIVLVSTRDTSEQFLAKGWYSN